MENPATLLTAIMFVTILGMAIGNLLMACADIAGGHRDPAPSRLHLSWMVLLLLAMLSIFWETTAILDVQDWAFVDFLYIILGPMLVLFATGITTAPATVAAEEHYFAISGRFFAILAIHEAWLIGVDLQFASLSIASAISGALMVLFILLAATKNTRTHTAGNAIAWIGYIAPLPLQILTG